ncbi:SNARE-associated Snapin [Brachionus plicatilis]|uniref:Biogenesis of lysosome-related organelles complex 1 subunit 7 n=1 Tax=Brachionus plicatilis TaxID=10195 RepID=A0A3M7PS35_BRAPC|nr:SNARE-associated Snapin [Brachionus plicatilis]
MSEDSQPKQKETEELANLSEEIRQNMNISRAKINENLLVTNFVAFFGPLIQNLDSNVQSLRHSQIDLQDQIKTLLNQEIGKIYEDEKKRIDLDEHTKRLVLTKKKLNSVQATILAVQERLNRIYTAVHKDPNFKTKQTNIE